MATAVWKQIDAGNIQPVYVLTGVEQYVFDETIRKLTKAIPMMESSDIIRFDLEETPVEIVLEEADTLPFLQERKLIIAKNATFLKAQDRSKEKVVHQVELLEQWLKNPSPTATVVFIAPFPSLDSRKKITKAFKKNAVMIEATKLEGTDLTVWIQQEASSKGLQIEREMAQFLIEMAGDDLLSLATEIEKIALFLGEGEVVTQQVIEQLVPRTPEMDVFRLTDAYVNGDVPKSITVYKDLLRNGEEPIMLTSLIAGQVRLMLQVGTLLKKGYQQQQIAKTLSVHPYRVKLVASNRRIPNEKRLMQILQELATIDYQLKSTSGNRARLLELFFMKPI